jgi:hypothetical protein
VGSATYLPPNVAPLVLGRTQNEARLLEEGKLGWPLLILHGDRDQQINGSAVIRCVSSLNEAGAFVDALYQ